MNNHHMRERNTIEMGSLSRLDRIVGFLTTLNIDVNTAYVNKDIVSKNHKVHFFILQKLVEDVDI